MLQSIREKTSGWITKVVLGALIFVFSFFGIESYFVGRAETFVAKVGDTEISQQDFRTRYERYRQQQLQQFGGAIDASYFERPEMKRQMLDQMIDEQVVLEANQKLGIAIGADRVRDVIMKEPAFQVDGKFSLDQYRLFLAGQRIPASKIEDDVRRSLAVRELPMDLAKTGFVTNDDVDAYVRLRDQQRDVRVLKIEKPAAADTNVADAEIETYYKEHGGEFVNPEQIAIEYIELDASKLAVDAKPDDAALKEKYEKEKARYVTAEQRLASHVLVKVQGNGGPDEQKKALAKAEDIAKQAKAGKDFATLAKENSDDPGSKNQGGDLGWLEKGVTDPAFEGALFALKKGEISDPVLSPEGYHVIDLRDVKPGSTRTFDEVKADLAKEYTEGERERIYSERSGRLTDLTYQDPTSLAAAAKELGVPVQKTGLFTRQGGEGIAADPKIVKAAFSDQVLVQGNNSDLVTLAPNHIVVLRSAEHKAVTPKPLDEVKPQIRERILAARVAKQAKARADELLARVEKGESLDAIARETKGKVDVQTGIGRNAANLDATLVHAAFEMPRPEEGKATYRLVDLRGDTYAIVQLDKVVDGDPSKLDATTREAARNTLAQAHSAVATRDFIDALRKSMKVTVAEDRLSQ